MANNNKVLIVALLVTASLFSIAAGLVWLGFVLRTPNRANINSNTTISAESTSNPTTEEQASSATDRQINYQNLSEYLQQKDWKSADRETYELMLKAAGPKAQARGMIPEDEMKNFSCSVLKKIDDLWSKASDGQQGFSAQQNLLRAVGDYRKMYSQVGWQDISGEWAIEWNYNLQTKKMEYKPGKEPKFTNPPPGHFPTVERGYNFNVSINLALDRCGF